MQKTKFIIFDLFTLTDPLISNADRYATLSSCFSNNYHVGLMSKFNRLATNHMIGDLVNLFDHIIYDCYKPCITQIIDLISDAGFHCDDVLVINNNDLKIEELNNIKIKHLSVNETIKYNNNFINNIL